MADGNGLCTSFAIAVNEASRLESDYINYGAYRVAHKNLVKHNNEKLLCSSYPALEPLPGIFYRGGIGTCTVWAISFDEDQYVDYEAGYRVVFKRLDDGTAIGVDSGAQGILCLNPGAKSFAGKATERWHYTEGGPLKYDQNDPHHLADQVDAINA